MTATITPRQESEHGYVLTRREICACGSAIVVRLGAPPEQIAEAVHAHNATPMHAMWRLEHGIALRGAP